MTDKQSVAGTIMAKNQEGKYVFLVKNNSDNYSFISTKIQENKTGLACIIEELKETLSIDASSLGLYELTNAVVNHTNIPLFVFELRDENLQASDLVEDKNSLLSWQRSEGLIGTFKEWQISGVPQFK